MSENKSYWYEEWQHAKRYGKIRWAATCKNMYKEIVIESLKKPYNMYFECLKQFPMIYLN